MKKLPDFHDICFGIHVPQRMTVTVCPRKTTESVVLASSPKQHWFKFKQQSPLLTVRLYESCLSDKEGSQGPLLVTLLHSDKVHVGWRSWLYKTSAAHFPFSTDS